MPHLGLELGLHLGLEVVIPQRGAGLPGGPDRLCIDLVKVCLEQGAVGFLALKGCFTQAEI